MGIGKVDGLFLDTASTGRLLQIDCRHLLQRVKVPIYTPSMMKTFRKHTRVEPHSTQPEDPACESVDSRCADLCRITHRHDDLPPADVAKIHSADHERLEADDLRDVGEVLVLTDVVVSRAPFLPTGSAPGGLRDVEAFSDMRESTACDGWSNSHSELEDIQVFASLRAVAPLIPIDQNKRSEFAALAIVLSCEPGAHYEEPQRGSERTPDWALSLPDGRLVALEVTSRHIVDSRETVDIGHGPVPISWQSGSWQHGEDNYLLSTLRKKMRDKARRNQFASVAGAERWLAVSLDGVASAQMSSLFEPLVILKIDKATGNSYGPYHQFRFPDFGHIMQDAESYGYDEIWCLAQSAYSDGRTVVLRLFPPRMTWECFTVVPRWHFEHVQDAISQRI